MSVKQGAAQPTVSGQSTVRQTTATASLKPRLPQLKLVFSPDTDALNRVVALSEEQSTVPVGRDVGATGVSAKDTRMSRLHFRLVWDAREQVHRLGDAGSANGTFVNGELQQSTILNDGDVIRAGDTLFVYGEERQFAAASERAALAATSDLSILLLGETGTGKEVLARTIHEKSERSGQFVAINCATIPRDLVAAELFGHTKGAFSGALKARPGLFRAAADGTLFLDEIADLPLDVQPALLRVLQERKGRSLGAETEFDVTARVLSATHVDLSLACSEGRFREDLYARLAGVVVRVPPLRERRSEILSLFALLSATRIALTPDAAHAMLLWDWPHNIRELGTLARTFPVLRPGQTQLDLEFLLETKPELQRTDSPEPERTQTSDDLRERRKRLVALLTEHSWNITAVARAFGKPRAQIYRWIRTFGLSKE